MSRLQPVDPHHANGRVAELLAAVRERFGRVPNLYASLAVAPAALDGFQHLTGALNRGSLPQALRAQISLYSAELNRSAYGLSVFTTVGKTVAGLSDEAIAAARRGIGTDRISNAALALAGTLHATTGHVADADYRAALDASLTEQQIVEIVVLVGTNILSNLVTAALQVEVDFPLVAPR